MSLLNRIKGQRWQIHYRFPRAPDMAHVELIFTNMTNKSSYLFNHILKIRMFSWLLWKNRIFVFKQQSHVNIEGFNEIDILSCEATMMSPIDVDFNDKTQPGVFDGKQLSVWCHVGELIEQKFLSEQELN